MKTGIHAGRLGRDRLEEGLRLRDGQGGSRGRSKLWALNGVGEGLRVLVGSGSGMGEMEGEALEWGKES